MSREKTIESVKSRRLLSSFLVSFPRKMGVVRKQSISSSNIGKGGGNRITCRHCVPGELPASLVRNHNDTATALVAYRRYRRGFPPSDRFGVMSQRYGLPSPRMISPPRSSSLPLPALRREV